MAGIVFGRPGSFPTLNWCFLFFAASSMPPIVTAAVSKRLNLASVGSAVYTTEVLPDEARALRTLRTWNACSRCGKHEWALPLWPLRPLSFSIIFGSERLRTSSGRSYKKCGRIYQPVCDASGDSLSR